MNKKYVWIGIAVLVVGCLLLVNTTSATHEITINTVENGGFETGDFTKWQSNGGYNVVVSDSGVGCSGAAECHYSGQYAAEIAGYIGSGVSGNITQEINFYNLDSITFYRRISSTGAWHTATGKAYIGGVLVWEESVGALNSTNWAKIEIDTSSYEGLHNIKFECVVSPHAYQTGYLYVDVVKGEVTVDLEEIRNPSFEDVVSYDSNSLIQWSAWTDVNMASGSHSESAAQSGDTYYHGSNALKLVADVNGVGTTAAGVTQQIDLSSTTPYLNFRMFTTGGEGNAAIVVTVDGNNVWQYSSATVWEEFSAPLSGYTGTSEISIYAIATGASASNITAYIDAVSFGSLQDVTLKGKVYDAVTGAVLSGVVVNCSQMGGVVTDTSDAMGNYEITGLFTNYDIYLDATKTDYNHHQTYFHFSNGGEKTVNIYMLPYTEHGLYGLVIDHNGEAVPAASVKVWNTTWENTTTTNSYGYFCFKNLTGLYEIQGSKAGMQASSIETITMEDLITALDNCEAITGWNSSGSVATNSTLKKQGSYSVRCNDTDALLCNKTFSPANNTNLTYGKLQFWAYIENSSAISTLEASLIDSSSDYKKWTGLSGTNGWNYFELWVVDASGSADLTDIVKFEVNATGSGEIVILFDEIRAFEPATDFVFLTLYGFFTLTISAKNIDTAESIMAFTATLDGAFTEGTTTGVVSFTQVVGGVHTVYVSAEGYYGGTGSPYVWHNMTYAVYLLSTDEDGNITGGAGVYYPPPHLVEFRVQTWQGIPYSGVNVTAKGYSTTMGTWDWLYSIFGYKNETQIHNVTMSDTTDSNGAISFLMVPTIKYEMTFTKGTEINETLYIAPGVRFYKIIIGTKWVETLSQWDVVNYSILVGELNDTHSYINFSYVDANNKTTSLDYFINRINRTSSSNIYNHSYDIGNSSNITNSYIVERGDAYLIGFEGDNLDYNEIKYLITIRIFEKDKRLLELEGVPDYIYTYISIGALMLVAAFFGMVTVPEGGIVVCLEAWVLWFIGFFLWQNPLAPLYLTVATVFAILIIFTAKGRQKGVS